MMAARQVRSAANGDDLSARHPDSRRPEPDSDHHHDDAQARSQSQLGLGGPGRGSGGPWTYIYVYRLTRLGCATNLRFVREA